MNRTYWSRFGSISVHTEDRYWSITIFILGLGTLNISIVKSAGEADDESL